MGAYFTKDKTEVTNHAKYACILKELWYNRGK